MDALQSDQSTKSLRVSKSRVHELSFDESTDKHAWTYGEFYRNNRAWNVFLVENERVREHFSLNFEIIHRTRAKPNGCAQQIMFKLDGQIRSLRAGLLAK